MTASADRAIVGKLARGSLLSRLTGHGRKPLRLTAVPRDHVEGERALGDALLAGRFVVSPADILRVARPVLRHRVLPNFAAEAKGITAEQIIDRLLEDVKPPKSEIKL